MIYDVPVAKTAADVYMRRLLGNVNEPLPLPTNKVEVFLYLLCGGEYNTPQPITSEERFLAYLLGMTGVSLPTPQTRLETYMDKVCRRARNIVVPPKTRYELYWWLWAGVTEIGYTMLPVVFQTSLPYLRNYQIYGNTNSTRPNAIDNTQWSLRNWYYDEGELGHPNYGASTDYMLYGGTVTLNYANPPRELSFVYFDSDKNFISRNHVAMVFLRPIRSYPPDNAVYFKLQVSCNTDETITDEYIENLGVVLTTQFITPDSTANYSFVGEKTVNLFDINGNTAFIYEGCHIQDDKFIIRSIGNGATSRIYWLNVYPAGTYFITAKFDGGVSDVRFYSSSPFNGASYNNYYQGWYRVIRDGIAVTFEQDFTVGFIVQGSKQSYGEVYDIQIQNGIMGTNFEPYGKYKIPITINGNTTNVYMDEPLRKIGSYADYIDYRNQCVVRCIKELKWNGTEPDGIFEGSSRVAIRTTPPVTALNSNLTSIYCNKAEVNGSSEGTNPNIFSQRLGDATPFIWTFVPYTFFTTDEYLNEWSTKLREWYNSGAPMISYYAVETPITEPLTLPQLPTQDGTNTLTVETTVAPSKVVIEA